MNSIIWTIWRQSHHIKVKTWYFKHHYKYFSVHKESTFFFFREMYTLHVKCTIYWFYSLTLSDMGDKYRRLANNGQGNKTRSKKSSALLCGNIDQQVVKPPLIIFLTTVNLHWKICKNKTNDRPEFKDFNQQMFVIGLS